MSLGNGFKLLSVEAKDIVAEKTKVVMVNTKHRKHLTDAMAVIMPDL